MQSCDFFTLFLNDLLKLLGLFQLMLEHVFKMLLSFTFAFGRDDLSFEHHHLLTQRVLPILTLDIFRFNFGAFVLEESEVELILFKSHFHFFFLLIDFCVFLAQFLYSLVELDLLLDPSGIKLFLRRHYHFFRRRNLSRGQNSLV